MSLFKRINLIKIVPLLTTGLLVSCFLLSEKIPELGLFKPTISNAIEITNGTQWQSTNNVNWSQYDSKTLSCYWVINGYRQDSITYIQNFGVNISVAGGYDLEYYIRYELRNGSYIETDWYNVQDTISVAYRWDDSNTSNLRVYYYVRRVDGVDLSSSDPLVSRIFANGIIVSNQDPEQTTAIPPEWFDTTTATVPELTTYTTVATTVPYEGLLTTLTVPADIRPAIAQFEQIIYDVWNLHYIPFIIIFAILVGLAAWLLH